MSNRVIKLSLKTLSYAQILLVTTHDEHFACRKFHRTTIIMGEGRLNQVPRTILVVFESRRRDKIGGVAAYDRRLAVH